MSTSSMKSVKPTASRHSGNALRNALVATGAALALVLAGMLVVPTSEQGSLLSLIGVLLLLVAGLVGVILGIVWAVRALRQGRWVAIAPLILDALLLFYCLVAMLAAFGEFYGWDG